MVDSETIETKISDTKDKFDEKKEEQKDKWCLPVPRWGF